MKAEFINSAIIIGKTDSQPVFSHTYRGEGFYRMPVRVARLSGAEDVLPLTIPAALEPRTIGVGKSVLACGQLRSYRQFDGERDRLCLTVFCKTLQVVFEDFDSSNNISIAGFLAKEPIIRRTPLGRDICDLLVSVPRPYGKSDILPVIAWGANAGACAGLISGGKVFIKGRFQSRIYQKKLEDGRVEERTAYELSASEITAGG